MTEAISSLQVLTALKKTYEKRRDKMVVPRNNVERIAKDGIVRSFFDTAVSDILRCICGHSLLGSVTLSVSCIECLGILQFNEENPTTRSWGGSGTKFRNFVSKYMCSANHDYHGKEQKIRIVRNMMVHNYGKNSTYTEVRFGHNNPSKHLFEEAGKLWIQVPRFVSETIAATEGLFRETRNLDLLREWHDRTFRVFDSVPPQHGKNHEYLSVLNNDPLPSIPEVAKHISDKLYEKFGIAGFVEE